MASMQYTNTQHRPPIERSRNALVVSSEGRYEVLSDTTTLVIQPGMMRCNVQAVALNPVDAKILQFSPTPGCVGGWDFAGTVVEIGEEVSRFKCGDRIFGLAFGMNPEDKKAGAFADQVLATEDLSCKIPSTLSFEKACTIGVAAATSGLAICELFGCSTPDELPKAPDFVLVWGGATSTGRIALQLLKYWGFNPIATCSSGSAHSVKSLGAIETFDYHSSECGRAIRDYTKGTLKYVLDCTTSSETMTMCYQAIGDFGGRYWGIEAISTHVKYSRRDVQSGWVVAPTMFGHPVRLKGIYGRIATPSHRKLAARLFPLIEHMIAAGDLVLPSIEIRDGGLEAIPDGIKDLSEEKIKGRKLVYSLTPLATR